MLNDLSQRGAASHTEQDHLGGKTYQQQSRRGSPGASKDCLSLHPGRTMEPH